MKYRKSYIHYKEKKRDYKDMDEPEKDKSNYKGTGSKNLVNFLDIWWFDRIRLKIFIMKKDNILWNKN